MALRNTASEFGSVAVFFLMTLRIVWRLMEVLRRMTVGLKKGRNV